MSIMIPIIFIILLITGLVLIISKKAVNLGKILIMPCIASVVFVAVVIAGIAIMFTDLNTSLFVNTVIVLGILVIVLSGCALWRVLKKKWVYIPLCSAIAVCVAIIGINVAHHNYVESIPTISEGESLLYDYAPYNPESKAAQLDKNAQLRIESDFPIMDGATALYPIYSAFAKAVYPKEIIDDSAREKEYLNCSTTSKAYEKIVTGEADIIFAAEPSEKQKQFALDNGVELVYTPIGKEAFVFFVNSKNPIDDISMENIQKIYSGEVTEWSALGVEKLGEIKAFQRDEGSGSQSALIRLMNGKELMTPPQEDVIDGMGGIIDRTADYKNFKNAIGYSFRFYSTEMVKNNQIKLLKINGIEPNIENIENGTYPIASEFYAVTRSDATENTQKLLEWILSEEGQKLVELTGYTPIKYVNKMYK